MIQCLIQTPADSAEQGQPGQRLDAAQRQGGHQPRNRPAEHPRQQIKPTCGRRSQPAFTGIRVGVRALADGGGDGGDAYRIDAEGGQQQRQPACGNDQR